MQREATTKLFLSEERKITLTGNKIYWDCIQLLHIT